MNPFQPGHVVSLVQMMLKFAPDEEAVIVDCEQMAIDIQKLVADFRRTREELRTASSKS